MASPIERSFSGGEVSPQLYGRVDQAKYASGLRTCRNMPVMRHGGVINRPGLQFIAEQPFLSGDFAKGGAKFVPFIFNQKTGETFLVVITSGYISFIQNGGQVVEGPVAIGGITNANPGVVFAPGHGYSTLDEVIISGVSGMTQVNNRNFLVLVIDANHFSLFLSGVGNVDTTSYGAYVSGGSLNRVYKLNVNSTYGGVDVTLIKWAQTGDVITLVHPNVPPQELQRISALNWQLIPIDFRAPVTAPSGVSASGGTASAGNNAFYLITAVNANGDETEQPFAPGAGFVNFLVNQANPMTINWTASPDAVLYRIYKTVAPSANGIFGFIGTTNSTTFVDYGITPDYTNSLPALGPSGNIGFAGAGNYPSTVGFVQQRRCFGNSINDPTTIWMSRSGSFSNFAYHVVGAQPDDDPIVFIPANEQVNSIEHIIELRQMLLLTSGAEIAVNGNSSGTVTPSAVNPQAQSFFGAGILKPITFGDVCLFQQARGWFVRDLGYAFEINGYRGNDLTIFSSHLFEGFTLENWTYQQIPNSIAWMARSDGDFLGLTYVREQQILAWHRHDTINGTVLDVCSVPENPEDGVYFLIRRTISGVVRFYIERMANFHWSDVTQIALMDSWLRASGDTSNSSQFVQGITGGTTWDSDEILIMRFNAAYAKNPGDQIWVTSPSTGQQIRFTIVDQIDTQTYHVRSNRIVPVDCRAVNLQFMAPIQTVTNLWTLEGQQVSIFADGFVVGSPNNREISTVYTVTNGQLTLDKPYQTIFVGLPITYDVETLDIDTSFGDSLLDTKKNITRVAAYAINTRGVFAGQRNPDMDPLNTAEDPLYGLMERKPEAIGTYDDVWPSETKPIYINIEANWNRFGRVFIRQVDPVPMQLVAISPDGLLATKSPYYVKV